MLDPEREIRFLYPPIFFVASLLWGLHLDPDKSLEQMFPGATLAGSLDRIVVTAVTGTIVLIASGLLISTCSICVLKAWSWFARKPYEAHLTDDALNSVATHLKLSVDRVPADALYLSAMLDHDLIPDRLHRWIFRRWSMFYVSANSATAILLSLIVGPLVFGIRFWSAWPLQAIPATGLLIMTARWAWLDTMGMLNFQAGLARRPAKTERSLPNGAPE